MCANSIKMRKPINGSILSCFLHSTWSMKILFMVYWNKLKLYIENVKVTINEEGIFYVNGEDKIEY